MYYCNICVTYLMHCATITALLPIPLTNHRTKTQQFCYSFVAIVATVSYYTTERLHANNKNHNSSDNFCTVCTHSVVRLYFVCHYESISRHFARGMLKCRKANWFECSIGACRALSLPLKCLRVCAKWQLNKFIALKKWI